MEGLRDRVLPHQQIPIDADCVLHADVYLPKAPSRYPAVVSFGGDNTDRFTAGVRSGANEIGSPSTTTRGPSPGPRAAMVQRRGRVFGTSYYAMTQLMVAARRPPALKAFFANELTTDILRDVDRCRPDRQGLRPSRRTRGHCCPTAPTGQARPCPGRASPSCLASTLAPDEESALLRAFGTD